MSPLSWTHKRVSVAGCARMGFRQFISSVIGFILLLGVMWPHAKAFGQTQTGEAIAKITRSGFAKSNQNKVFYHDGKWWAIAYNASADKWYVWRFSNGAWDKTASLNKSKTYKYDAVVNSAAGKLYVMGSHPSSSEFWRFSYSTSTATWAKDAGFKVNPGFTNSDGSNPVSLIQASNGDLWIFRVAGNKLQAKRSTNGGATWSAVIDVKTGLTTASGTTDAVAFTADGNSCVGVAYGESDAAGSQYGFLIHRDGDPDDVWTDESAALTFFGSERADNKIAATTDQYNNVYLFTQNASVSNSVPNNTLYKRSISGGWTKFVVNDNAGGLNWKTPAVVADISNEVLYVMGVNTSTQFAEYKTCAIGAEASLSMATTTAALASTGASFDDLSVPTPFVNAASGLMICGDNVTKSDIWYNQLDLGSSSSGQPPVTVNSVNVAPNEANTAGSYTISLTLGNQGALSAGGTITIQFPANTSVPNSIATNQITVNGAAAAAVVSNSSATEVTITVPNNLANSANVTLGFGAGANLLNPANAGSYSLQAWTSTQTSLANSPSYAITAATTTVSAATVTPNPTATNSASAYTIAFSLGSHGRLVSGSTITLTFNNATTVANGNLSGVQVNGVSATATSNSSNKTVTIILQGGTSLSLNNGAAVTLGLPSSAITNPSSPGNYTLTVATSVETTPVASNAYAIAASPLPTPPATGDDAPISGTTGGYDKPHQNRPFYHDGIWWTAARKSSDGKWYLWKLNGASWSAELQIDSRSSTRPDCYVDSPKNKLYILLASSSSTGTKILRLSYSGSAWSIDAGFPVVLSSFTFSSESGNVFVKAKNGELWAFRYFSGKVEGKRSRDDGLTWSSTFTVKGSLVSAGLCDAVAFTSGGENYVGVGYAENTSTSGKFGFLLHKDGDPDVDWTNETGLMPQFSSAQSDDHMSMAVSKNNEIFFVCKTHPNSSSAAGIGLLKRNVTGDWQNFTVQQDGGWTRPAVVIDETNNELYVFGTQEGSPKYGQYKKCAIGNESSLKNAAAVTIFDDNDFNNLSVPQHRVTDATEMLVCVEKSSGSEIWYNVLPISGSGSSTKSAANSVADNSAEVLDDGGLPRISAYPNPFNPATTIRFKLTAPAPVLLQIFNLRGALVRTLLDRDLNAGTHEQFWNGRDNFGRQVASGTYFYRLHLGAEVWRGRLEMVK